MAPAVAVELLSLPATLPVKLPRVLGGLAALDMAGRPDQA